MSTTAPTTTPTSTVPASSWLPGFLLLAAIWGSSFLLIKVGVAELPPLYVSGGRVLTGALALLIILLIRRDRLPADPRVWAHNLVVGVIGIAAPFSLFAYGEQRISSSLAGIWNAMTPLIVLPVAVLVFRTERFSPRKGIGLVLGFFGALIILGVWRGVGGSGLSGQLMCLGAAVCYGLTIPYVRRFIAPLPHSSVAMSAQQLIAGTAVLAVLAPAVYGPPPVPSPQVALAVAVLGAVGTGVAFLLNLRNIRAVGASTASMVTYVIPVFATALGVLVLGERISWYQPVGAAVVLLGVAVAQGLGRRRS